MKHLLARAAPSLYVVLWATGFVGARYAMPWAEPFLFLLGRFALTIALLGIIILLMRARRVTRIEALNAMIAGILMQAFYLGGVFWAISRGMPAGLAALIVGLQPMITALMAGVFLGERVGPRHWAGMATGLAGVAIVLSPKLGEAAGVTAPTLTAAFVAVVAMSVGTVWQKRFVARADLVTGTLLQYLGGALAVGAASLAFEQGRFVVTGELVFAMAWLVIVLSIGAIFLLMYLLREGEVAKVASLFYLVPAVTALLAWLLFGETLSLVQIAGMAVTAAGVALATRNARQAQPATRLRASL
jgi:drug/metabolite transporter (DMT)-like permease